jgi:small redox-active disulfide protein 2
MKIQVLGPGCTNCVTLESRTRAALTAANVEATIEKVSDYAQIARLGVMKTPGLVIDGRVVVSGRVPSVEEIRGFLSAR